MKRAPFTIWMSIALLVVLINQGYAGRIPVWIDTDPSCGLGTADDVDDCWALLLALKSEKVGVVGVSTVFGNVSEERAYPVANEFLRRFSDSSDGDEPPLYRGSKKPFDEDETERSSALEAIATALNAEDLTIVALGPLTNIASLLRERPDLGSRIRSIIAVGGSSTGERRFFFEESGLLHFHDLNFLKDPRAFDVILKSGIPLILMPFEVAQKVLITPSDLNLMKEGGDVESWLASASRGWLEFWRSELGEHGFYSFDSLAMGYVINPTHFTCHSVTAMVNFRHGRFRNRDELTIEMSSDDSSHIAYCKEVSPDFHDELISVLSE